MLWGVGCGRWGWVVHVERRGSTMILFEKGGLSGQEEQITDTLFEQHLFEKGEVSEGCRESRRCSQNTFPESYITKYTSV